MPEISRQLIWQRKKKAEGRCTNCANPVGTWRGGLCKPCYEKKREYRNWRYTVDVEYRKKKQDYQRKYYRRITEEQKERNYESTL